MNRLLVFWVFLVGIPFCVQAGGVKITSGEHAGFTRLVVQFEEPADWEFGKTENGYELRSNAILRTTDLNTVFVKIPKTRIQDVKIPSEGVLNLLVNCSCHADAFELRDGRIVLDIKTGVAIEGSEFEQTLPEELLIKLTATRKLVPVALKIAIASMGLPNIKNLPKSVGERVSADSDAMGMQTRGPIHYEWDPMTALNEALEPSEINEKELFLKLGKAVGMGLLKIEPKIELMIPEGPESKYDPLGNSGHMFVHDGVDRRTDPALSGGPILSDDGVCLEDIHFDLENWGTNEITHTNFSLGGARVISDMETPTQEEILLAARNYIYLGFGVEALALLVSTPSVSTDIQILTALSFLLDSEKSTSQSILMGQQDCANKVAMWSFLITSKTHQHLATQAILQTFANLPTHLQRNVGPRLVQRFLDMDELGAAHTVGNQMNRVGLETNPEMGLMMANLEASSGHPNRAIERTQNLLRSSGSNLPETVVSLVNHAIYDGTQLDQDIAVLSGALALENQGTRIGEKLQVISIIAYADRGEYSKAFFELQTAVDGGEIDPLEATSIQSQIYSRAVKAASDISFLLLIDKYFPSASSVSGQVERAISIRLIGLGFQEIAKKVMALNTEIPSVKDRLVLAQISVDLGNSGVAISYLEGIPNHESAGIRAKISELMGMRQQAADHYEFLQQPLARRSALWRSSNWAEISKVGSPAQRELAFRIGARTSPDLSQQESEILKPTNGASFEGRAVVADSRSVRKIIGELLVE